MLKTNNELRKNKEWLSFRALNQEDRTKAVLDQIQESLASKPKRKARNRLRD